MQSSRGPGGDPAPGLTQLVVAAKRPVSDSVMSIELVSPTGERMIDWSPGAHIDLVLPGGLVRQYSLCGDRFDPTRYRIAVLREPAGRGGSAYVHDELAVGDLVGVGAPRNNFPMVPATQYLFVAGGVGITALLPMIRQAELLGLDWQLLYGGRTRASMAFLDELTSYGDRVSVRPQDEFGLLDVAAFVGPPRPGAVIYCCGPAPLLNALTSTTPDWPGHLRRIERFSADESRAGGPDLAFDVVLARSGTTVTVAPGTTVLEALRGVGVDVLSSCGAGVCGTCETRVLAGRPDHRDGLLGEGDDMDDAMYVCVSRSRDPRLVLDL